MDKNKWSKEINVTKAIWKLSYVKTAHFSCKYDNYMTIPHEYKHLCF